MFGELFQFIKEVAELVWPFRIVPQYERACYYRCGHFWKVVGPGLKIVIPWFFDIYPVPVSKGIVGTGRCDITLADGRTLSFAATGEVRVVDPAIAVNEVDKYSQTAQELFASVVADELSRVDVDRLAPERRGRLHASIINALNTESATYGLEFSKLRFKSFVIVGKSLRLLIDQTQVDAW